MNYENKNKIVVISMLDYYFLMIKYDENLMKFSFKR